MKSFLIALTLSCSPYALASGWNGNNNPYNLGHNFQAKFSALPLSGGLKDQRLGWPGSHWANYIGGIANRWSAGIPQNFTYKLLSLAELRALEPHQLDELSPAEKFDIFNGNYNYPTVKKVYRTVSPYESQWHGICHGYAPSALNHPEPATRDLVNPDGIKVHFYSSDIAALMSFYYANVVSTPVSLIGTRCNYNPGKVPRRRQDECNDLNAGAFHIVIANKLGEDGSGFIADIDRYSEVWNHVAVSFTSTARAESAPVNTSAYGTVKRIHIEATVTFAAAIAPKFDPVINTEAAEYAHNSYEYFLDLDKTGKIIGGDWVSEARPDFVWTQKQANFTGEWSSLDQIYLPAAQ
jgi:hypothetical protein